jgi:hypothetical protein
MLRKFFRALIAFARETHPARSETFAEIIA